ncbi:flagellar hook-associated protein FlgK [Litorivivens sp.]|uniref:flagellar hook-associated protein FlgK n=1 Tax=Litorivivens sp. TaxID=2020868 RepID=UPI0035697C84
MADMLNSALSAIVTYQRALATTSHNIANVNTEGYSRQTVSLSTNTPQYSGFGAIGSGVGVSGIARQFDQFVLDQMRSSASAYNHAQAYTDMSSQIDNLLSDTTNGVSAALTSFFNSLQQLADDPGSLSARQAVLAETDTLVSRLDSVTAQFGRIEQELNTRMRSSVEEINGLTAQIAQLNKDIAAARISAGGQAPNDMLDERDKALFELSSYLDIKVVSQDGDTTNVFTGSGDALVLNKSNFELGVTRNEYYPNRLDVSVETTAGQLNLSERISGGSLGGALDFREQVMDPTLSKLGRMTYGLATTINQQHAGGMTLNGSLGGDFFRVGGPEVVASANNSGGALVNASIADTAALGLDNYRLEYDGSNYRLINGTTGSLQTMTGSGSAADPFQANGVSIVVSGSAAAGDRFLIQPTASVSGSLERAINSAADIAAASATRVSASITNSGSVQIANVQVSDSTDPALLASASIQFLNANTYQINGAGSFAYTSGSTISINGTDLILQGEPAAGDSFNLSANSGGVGDNRNLRAMLGIQDAGMFNNGNTSVMESAATVLGDVAVATRSSSIRANSQLSLLNQNVARRESVSGVNLEEEAANMLRYQQAYQAAAQAVSTSNTIFQTLINAFR